VRAPQTAVMPPITHRISINRLLPTDATVYPEVVRTPTPTMLATTMNVAIARPNSAGIDPFSAPNPGPTSGFVFNSVMVIPGKDGVENAPESVPPVIHLV